MKKKTSEILLRPLIMIFKNVQVIKVRTFSLSLAKKFVSNLFYYYFASGCETYKQYPQYVDKLLCSVCPSKSFKSSSGFHQWFFKKNNNFSRVKTLFDIINVKL